MSIPEEWLQAQLRLMSQQSQDQHQRLRSDMTAGFDKITAAMTEHAKDDQKVETRVTIIETQRAGEAREAVKRSTYVGLLAGLIGPIMINLFQSFFTPKSPTP